MQKALNFGKVPYKELKDTVFKHLGMKNDKVILGPKVGEDGAIINIGSKFLVISTDPITGATKNVGWLSVHINANDIASFGVKPSWYLCSILLPKNSRKKLISEIMSEIDKACKELGIAVIGGHSEVSAGLNRPIVFGTMIGETKKTRYVTSSGTKPGDKIILTKSIGLEGTSILANDFYDVLKNKIDNQILKRGRDFIQHISVVNEALIAMKVGGVSAMHDLTEGGLLNGLWETAEASKTGIKIFEEKISVKEETKKICKALGIDFLGLLSSGALMICCRPDKAFQILSALENSNIYASIIGETTSLEEGRFMIRDNGKRVKINPLAQDEIYKVLGD
ncbi:hypothetical protein AC481_05290 [miscellaneous Crenarchaeota group archaeon SMTZ-80]|nr:MAG: hypothetical protein AC481_05290 [miscellaneous Crenarchaeota group archaeon SMTZ-80]